MAKEILCELLDYENKDQTDFKSLLAQLSDTPIAEIGGTIWLDYISDFIGTNVNNKWGVYASTLCEAIGTIAEMNMDFAAIDGVSEWEIASFQALSSTYLANYEVLTRIMGNLGGTFGLACLDIRNEMMRKAYGDLEAVIEQRCANKTDRFVQLLGEFGVLAVETVVDVTITELTEKLTEKLAEKAGKSLAEKIGSSLGGVSSGVAIAQVITAGKYDARNSTIAINNIENELRRILVEEQKNASGNSEQVYETLRMLLIARKVGIEKIDSFKDGTSGQKRKEFVASMEEHNDEINDLLESLSAYYTKYDLENGGDGLYGN